MTISEDDWLALVDAECRGLILRIGKRDFSELFGNLRKLFERPVEITETTWHVKNMIASLAMTDPEVIRGRFHLENAAIDRLAKVRSTIRDARPTGPR